MHGDFDHGAIEFAESVEKIVDLARSDSARSQFLRLFVGLEHRNRLFDH